MKLWLKKNWRRIARALIAACKAGVQAWKGMAVLLLAVALAGCTTTTTTIREYDASGRVVKQITMEGDVEAAAVQGHQIVAKQAMEQIKGMTTSMKVPTYDATGKQVFLEFKFVDSAAYRAMAEMADMTGYDSQGVKMAKEGFGLLGKAIQPGFTFWGYRELVRNGTGATNITTVKDSMNNNQQSTLATDSVGVNSDVTSSTVDQGTTTTTTTEIQEGEK